MLGDLLQQCYNIADTLVVSRAIGPDALAAVGSAFTLMTFLTSILLGLCLGSGAVFSMRFGEEDYPGLRRAVTSSFVLIGGLSLGLTALVFVRNGGDSLDHAGAGFPDGDDEGLPLCHLLGHPRHLSV